MITVHHLNNSRSQRILWLLEEAGLEYEIRKYMRDPETMRAPSELRDIHPLGKSPVITDGDQVIAESGAIVDYVVEHYATQLRPDRDVAAYRDYVYWLHFAEGTAMPPLLVKLLVERIRTAKAPFFIKPIARSIANRLEAAYVKPELAGVFGYVESRLSESDWLAGDTFTAADIQMSFPLEAAIARMGAKAPYPATKAYVERLHARPAYQRALERGGEYGIIASSD
ncbi:glutathione S-transferase [Maricaulis sp. CAU 1757]